MLGHSLNKLEHQDFGFTVQGHVMVELQPLPSTYTQPQLQVLYRRLEGRLSRLPGVRRSGLALYNPLTDNWGEAILVEGHPAPKMGDEAGSSWDRVSTDYLPNLGMRIVRGRGFTDGDNETAAPVAIVNETFVKRFFRPGEDPLEQHFGMDLPENAGTFRIVGVVRDAKFAGFALNKPARPIVFVPLGQSVNYKNDLMKMVELRSHFMGGIMLTTNQPPGALEGTLTKVLAEVDPNLTIVSVRTLEQQVALSFDQERAVASLAGLFGIVALVLAAVGLYGVTAYAVARRTNEIGIRMALGADRAKVVQLVLRGAWNRVLVGLLLGIPLAIGAGRLIAANLYGVASWDPLALSAAAGTLAICALFAALIPASRAASISPVDALRTE
jgi:predicted permease